MNIIEEVREAVAAIPPGRVASYGDIGRRIGAGPRQVGRAMSLLDDESVRRRNTLLVPWRTGTGPPRRGGDTHARRARGHEARTAAVTAPTTDETTRDAQGTCCSRRSHRPGTSRPAPERVIA
ncbi:MGMT family protein [Streptomyces sp. NPDC046805]|uniref:MGMT family protein n=1 Tax=Streptomyces sp. NPDC046805 TaxID=3155134 RepID=UPI0033EF65B7